MAPTITVDGIHSHVPAWWLARSLGSSAPLAASTLVPTTRRMCATRTAAYARLRPAVSLGKVDSARGRVARAASAASTTTQTETPTRSVRRRIVSDWSMGAVPTARCYRRLNARGTRTLARSMPREDAGSDAKPCRRGCVRQQATASLKATRACQSVRC